MLQMRASAEARLRSLPPIEDRRRERVRLAAEIRKADEKVLGDRLRMLARWSHKNEGTPETHEHASRTRQGALARLFASGAIDAEQLGWAVEIASAAEGIERDVAVRIVSYEPRIDVSHSPAITLVEGIMEVRRQVAYGVWRQMLPRQFVRHILDMIVGETISYTVIAKRCRMHNRRAKKMLIDALDLWPKCMDAAEDEVDAASLAAAHAGII